MHRASGLQFPKPSLPTKTQRKTLEDKRGRAFRDAVWEREQARDRATGQILSRVHSSSFVRGEVCHLKGRRVAPELKYNPRNAILLSAEHHRLSDGRGNNRLKLTDPLTGDKATDAFQPITFTLYDRQGNVIWSRTS